MIRRLETAEQERWKKHLPHASVAVGPHLADRMFPDTPRYPVLFLETPEGLRLLLGTDFPEDLWLPVAEGQGEAALAGQVRLDYPEPATRLRLLGYARRIGQQLDDLERRLAFDPFAAKPFWGSAFTTDPGPASMAEAPGRLAQAAGKVASVSFRTPYSHTQVHLEWHGLFYVADLGYQPTEPNEVTRRLHESSEGDLPDDLPLDAVALLAGFEAAGAPSIAATREQMGDRPGRKVVGLLHNLAALEVPQLAQALEDCSASPDRQVRRVVRMLADGVHEATPASEPKLALQGALMEEVLVLAGRAGWTLRECFSPQRGVRQAAWEGEGFGVRYVEDAAAGTQQLRLWGPGHPKAGGICKAYLDAMGPAEVLATDRATPHGLVAAITCASLVAGAEFDEDLFALFEEGLAHDNAGVRSLTVEYAASVPWPQVRARLQRVADEDAEAGPTARVHLERLATTTR